jgi:hypothetical protein
MTLHAFAHLPEKVQLAYVYEVGTYLARRLVIKLSEGSCS